jgi:ribosome-binding factor A
VRKTRLRRTDELLRETIAELILTRVGDPRVGFVSVTGVQISPELDTARVFVTVLGNPAEREAAMKGLKSAAPYLQSELHKRVRLRRTPRLRFVYDESVDRGFRIESALREAKAGEDDALRADPAAGGAPEEEREGRDLDDSAEERDPGDPGPEGRDPGPGPEGREEENDEHPR